MYFCLNSLKTNPPFLKSSIEPSIRANLQDVTIFVSYFLHSHEVILAEIVKKEVTRASVCKILCPQHMLNMAKFVMCQNSTNFFGICSKVTLFITPYDS